MSVARLLLVEDDPRIVSFLQPGLKAENYHVEVARNGRQGLELAKTGEFAVIILDYMLPGMNGLEICEQLRAEGCRSRILMLTAKDGIDDKIAGLKRGADDYMTKPFAFGELLARIGALLRREGATEQAPPAVLRIGDLLLDIEAKTLRRGARQIDLTPKEFALFAYLAANAGTVVSRAKLLSDVWGLNFDPGTKVVEVYIRYIRQKLEAAGAEPSIRTVRGFGYMVQATPADPATAQSETAKIKNRRPGTILSPVSFFTVQSSSKDSQGQKDAFSTVKSAGGVFFGKGGPARG